MPFDYEVSAIGVRGLDGEMAMYPLNRNLHRDGILRLTRAPWKSPRWKPPRAATCTGC